MTAQLSIITINLNNPTGLQNTINSVLRQTYSDFEYILIDGGSTQESLDILNIHKAAFSYYGSEPDQGIYHAMNKGIAKATGKYLMFLNSGDTLTHKDILKDFFKEISNRNADIFYTDVTFIDEVKKRAWTKHYPAQLNDNFFIKSSLCHQTSIIAKKVLDELGNYDENYTLSSDWMLSFTAFKKGYKYQKIEHLVLSNFVLNGFSTDFKLSREQRQIFIKTHYPTYLNTYLKFINQKSIFKRIKNKVQQLRSTIDLPRKRENYIKYVNSLKEN